MLITVDDFTLIDLNGLFFRLKHSLYEQNLPAIRNQLSVQKSNLTEIHQFLDERDKKMKEELSLLLSNITDRCHQELKGISLYL